nr:MAG TPA: hypothetical protein [Caudoviricetes sp.]
MSTSDHIEIFGHDKERADWETTYYPDIVLKGKTNEH